MEDWLGIEDFPASEQNKLRWLLRHATENGIVDDGVAVKFGKQWLINKPALPAFLRKLTQQRLRAKRGSRAA